MIGNVVHNFVVAAVVAVAAVVETLHNCKDAGRRVIFGLKL